MQIMIAVTALALLLAACSEPKKDVRDSVFAPQVKALEKARSVENTLRQGADKNREAIESSEYPSEPEQK